MLVHNNFLCMTTSAVLDNLPQFRNNFRNNFRKVKRETKLLILFKCKILRPKTWDTNFLEMDLIRTCLMYNVHLFLGFT